MSRLPDINRDALAPDDHPDPYVRNKAMSERALFRLRQRTGFPVATRVHSEG